MTVLVTRFFIVLFALAMGGGSMWMIAATATGLTN